MKNGGGVGKNEWIKSIKKLKTEADDPSIYLKYKGFRKSLKGIVEHAKRIHHLNLGLFPSILKTGKVSPVFKKDNPQLFKNYRPILRLPIFSKLFEKNIYKQIYAFLIVKNNVVRTL